MEEQETAVEKLVSLPDECWELVFSFLPPSRRDLHLETLSLVCKQLLSVTNKLRTSLRISRFIPVLPRIFARFRQLKHIELKSFKGISDHLFIQIAKSGLDLESLSISCMDRLPNTLRILGSRMPNLRSLECSCTECLPDGDLVMIAVSFPNLEELDIRNPSLCDCCSFEHLNSGYSSCVVTDAGIFTLIEMLPRLCKVNLSGISSITDKALVALTTNCLLLKELDICECDSFTPEGIATALRQSPNLISIWFDDCGLHSFYPGLIDSLVSMKNLSSLDISDSVISDELLHSVAEASLPLKKLNLSYCLNFSFSGISSLLYKNQFMEWLSLRAANFLTNQSVVEFSKYLRRVKFIDLSYCASLTCLSLFTLARNCSIVNEIEMEFVNIEEEENYPTDFVNPQVMSLGLSGNINLCDGNLSKIASIFPNLEVLKLSRSAKISEKAIKELLMACTRIRYLDLMLCTRIQNLAMDIELSSMESLSLEKLGIEDEALVEIGRRCPRLISLILQECPKVTSEGVKEIAKSCRGLRSINLRGCGGVDGNVIPFMVFSMPFLRRIVPPPSFINDDNQRQLFLRHACTVHYSS